MEETTGTTPTAVASISSPTIFVPNDLVFTPVEEEVPKKMKPLVLPKIDRVSFNPPNQPFKPKMYGCYLHPPDIARRLSNHPYLDALEKMYRLYNDKRLIEEVVRVQITISRFITVYDTTSDTTSLLNAARNTRQDNLIARLK